MYPNKINRKNFLCEIVHTQQVIFRVSQMKKRVRAFLAKEKIPLLKLVDPVQLIAGVSLVDFLIPNMTFFMMKRIVHIMST